jgi:bla regulator protein blaR1
MAIWMLYVIVVSLLLSGAALAAERTALLRRVPTRWPWVLSIAASVLVPAIVASVSIQAPEIPSLVSPAVSQKIVSLRHTTSRELSPAIWVGAGTRQLSARPSVNTLFRRVWAGASGALLLALLVSGAHLYWRKRRWEHGTIAGTSVYVTDDVGPAVVGLFRPRIAVPRWLTQSAAATQELVIAHERSHLEAHDVRLFAASLFVLVLMPWNLPVWWQMRRLRFAIEVDCDARVLNAGRDAAMYGETLIAVGQRHSGYVGAVAGMSESKSFLEERVRIMVRKPVNWWRLPAAALGCLSVALVVVAAQVEPPNAEQPSAGAHSEIELATTVLDGYTGYYRIGDESVMSITRNDGQLLSQITGQTPAPIYPESTTRFFYKVVNAQIDFLTDASGKATALVLHQRGVDHSAPRIDAEVARQVAANLEARIRNATPLPGSEAAARRFIAGVTLGRPNYDEMTPELAGLLRQQLSIQQPFFAGLGPLVSVDFKGVGNQGWDNYQFKYGHNTVTVRIALNSQGIITGELATLDP